MSDSEKDDSFPNIGVRLDYIDRFISAHGGVTVFQGLKTFEVVEQFIKPPTERKKVSYCEYLENQGYRHFTGKPNVFISHAWGDSFLELKDRLSSLNLPEYRPDKVEGDIVIWLDIFSNNQHTTTQKSHDWWETVFSEAVNKIDCTVFMLTPIAIAMSQTLSEKTRSFLFGPTIKIDSATSECQKVEDSEQLRAAIRSTGFKAIDSLVSQKMNEEVQRLRGLVNENIKEVLPIVPRETIVGIAVDFSGSMKTPFESLRSETEGKFTESGNLLSRIETIINALLERLKDTDMRGKHGRFFACAFGLEGRVLIGDLIHMIRYMVTAFKISRDLLLQQNHRNDLSPERCWENLIQFLEKNGAPYIRDYANKNRNHFSPDLVKFILPIMKDDKTILERLVERLPDCCKAMVDNVTVQGVNAGSDLLDSIFSGLGITNRPMQTQVKHHTEQSVKSIVDGTIKDVNDNYLQPRLRAKYVNFIRPLDKSSLITHEELQSLLNDWKYLKIDEQHSFLGEFNLFNTNFYGPSTPLYQTYSQAWEMFRGFESEEFGKVLLTISDGESTCETTLDESRGRAAIESLKQMNAQLVNCFLSTQSSTGKQLLSQRPRGWSEGPAFLFDNASEVKKDHP
eukprot:gene16888-19278_t